MKISVIIPVYNSEKYIENCVYSILHQTHKDLEIILINDGSGDDSGKICDELAAKDSRIKVIHQENKGVSAARNNGLLAATGDAVTFVDSDDTLDEDMYELLVRIMHEHNADIAHCGYKRINGNSVTLIHGTEQITVQNRLQALQCLVEGRLFVGSMCNKLYKRDIIKDISLREDLKNNEDILYNFMAFDKTHKSVYADFAKYNYLIHEGTSACFSIKGEKKYKDSCFVSKYMYDHLINTNLSDAAAERHARTLSGYFRCLSTKDKLERSQVSDALWKIYVQHNGISKKMKITCNLIRYLPRLYCFLFSAYDRIRKPNWDCVQ